MAASGAGADNPGAEKARAKKAGAKKARAKKAGAEKPNWWLRGARSGPGQAIRWLLVLALTVGHWLVTTLGPLHNHGLWLTRAGMVLGQRGNPGSFAGWVPVIIISVVLLLPDVETVAFGGVKLEMRRTQAEVADLRDQLALVKQDQSQKQELHSHFYLGGKVADQLASAAKMPDAPGAEFLRALELD
jgi:hypothetical protein